MNVGARVDQALDGFHLSSWIPFGRIRATVRSVMQRAASAVIAARIGIRSCRQQ